MRVASLLVAAGSGTRFGHSTAKQFLEVAGKPVLRHAAEALAPHCVWLQPVGDAAQISHALAGLAHLPPVAGGSERQDSVLAGLQALVPHGPDVVLVHDGARPFIPPGTIAALLAALQHAGGAIPAAPVADTLKRVEDGRITATVPRSGLFRAQTPQAFRFPLLLRLHRAAAGGKATDDAGLLEAAGEAVVSVPGSEDNIKVTFADDLMRVERLMRPPLLPRIGTGFDVHAFAAGRTLVLCGVMVPHELGLAGHSDADVGIHAVCDAIYGALADGDIGRHFPPSQVEWKEADSAHFLRHAAGRIAHYGGVLGNLDLTLICEQPKITPHAPAMIARLADLLGVAVGKISVKATTTERLGFTGRGEGIAAQAVATVLVPV
jgi:2-C-methyl-D-erythritol 4-phosphate cytidylyltransferase/2-C-methyl-D-erythritol 2,4-cyclodiphosphate synthase